MKHGGEMGSGEVKAGEMRFGASLHLLDLLEDFGHGLSPRRSLGMTPS